MIYAVTLLHMYGNLIINGRQGTLFEFQEEIRKHGYRPSRAKASLVLLQPLIKRDFYGYAFMLCCLLGILKVLVAGGSIGTFVTLSFI